MQVKKVSRIGHAVKIAYGACILWFALSIGYAFADDVAEDAARAAVLEHGDFVWQPELAPAGPTVIVVSLAEQRANVYRNGIRIAVAKVSSGRPGYETPTGVFSILQKRREHYSNLYDDAPMPFMQRLTWSGVALHAGSNPGYPASHGCVRLPYAFAERLFQLTSKGAIVVVTNHSPEPPIISYPGLFVPVAPDVVTPRTPETAQLQHFEWQPERAPSGPLSLIVGTRAGLVVATRGGQEVGRAAIRLWGEPMPGTRLYVLLDGHGLRMSPVVAGRPMKQWLSVPLSDARDEPAWDIEAVMVAGQLGVNPEFARHVYDALVPGSTVLITDQAFHLDEPTISRMILEANAVSTKQVKPPARR